MTYTHLEWDSTRFGYKIARINGSFDTKDNLKLTLQSLITSQYVLAYLFLPADKHLQNKIAMELNGRFVDLKLTYEKQTSNGPLKNDEYKINPYDISIPHQNLISLSIESGVYSRFKIDPNFNNLEYEKLYTDWILNSISKSIAFEVLLCFYEQQVVGLITLGVKDDIGSIGLIAVNSRFRGKGIGSKLVTAAENLFYEKQISRIQVVTQGNNIPACRLYQKCGFKLSNHENVYHYWLQKTFL